jgi:hypothetical protein
MLAKVRPSFKKQKLDFTCIVKTNPNLFKKNKIYLKEAEVDFKRGEACVPLINWQTSKKTSKQKARSRELCA